MSPICSLLLPTWFFPSNCTHNRCTWQLLSTNGGTQVTCGRNLNVIYIRKYWKTSTCDHRFLNGLKYHLRQGSVQLFSSVVFSWCSSREVWESQNGNSWKAKSLICLGGCVKYLEKSTGQGGKNKLCGLTVLNFN